MWPSRSGSAYGPGAGQPRNTSLCSDTAHPAARVARTSNSDEDTGSDKCNSPRDAQWQTLALVQTQMETCHMTGSNDPRATTCTDPHREHGKSARNILTTERWSQC